MSRNPDRLVLFTDAVAAIAITLLVLPLVELANEPLKHPVEVLTHHRDQIGSFVLSFVVIARLWLTHHRMFAHVKRYSNSLVLWNIGWLFTTVLLPFPTELVGRYGGEHFTVAFYMGTVLASSICLSALTLLIHRDPDIQDPENPLDDQYLASGVATTVLIVVALVLALAVPGVNYFSLLLLLLTPVVVRVWNRRRRVTS
ncbi:hypothetical protein AOZ06_19690 [Kibdelosporangium phytohabitans]|uniref:DUF1211 domain-containing membrane protein n=2 Tax=Kibdelosporangium phytohabitans TaxID=860235 RepID=A0A0N9I2Y2_9PSEU|nr:TMEM175 family protein [Kibdelosporangium phytohabitans]ALG08838.1 hypothetical protein AOZ06_19690 [Kibdelosporangium phytohabitans]